MEKQITCSGETRARATTIIIIALSIAIVIMISIPSSYAQKQSLMTDQDIQQLLQKLEEQDALIDDLQQRVKSLESQQKKPVAQQQLPATATPANNAQAPNVSNASTSSRPSQQAQAQNKPTANNQKNNKSSMGEFDVDEVAAERALDRSLVQTGALLLPFRHMELQPFVNYVRRENGIPALVINDLGQLRGIGVGDTQRNEFDFGFLFRAGLPLESQLELRLPARIIEQTSITSLGTTNLNDSTQTGAALGDISVGIAKTLTKEDGWIPDLVGRFTWDSDSGKINSNNVFMGTGFNDFRFSLTALKRQDPLAFTTQFDYQTTLKKNGIDRGDQYTLSLGASLAASPYTSLSMSLQQIWRQKTQISNINLAGSGDVLSIMNFGLTTRVSRKLFFTINGGIGLTDASPDYLINVSLPYRFFTR